MHTHVVAPLSAGLAAYASWVPTLKLLTARGGPPCVFTDYCEEAALRGAQVLAALAPYQHDPAVSPDDSGWQQDAAGALPGGAQAAEAGLRAQTVESDSAHSAELEGAL